MNLRQLREGQQLYDRWQRAKQGKEIVQGGIDITVGDFPISRFISRRQEAQLRNAILRSIQEEIDEARQAFEALTCDPEE